MQSYYGMNLDKKTGKEEVLYALKLFASGGKKYIGFIIKELEYFKADAIIYDYTFFSAIALSEKLNIPRIAIYHSGLPFYEYPIPEIGSNKSYNCFSKDEYDKNFQEIKLIENSIRNKYEKIINKKIDVSFLTEPSSKYLNIVTSIKEAEYPRNSLNKTVHFVGPCLQGISDKSFIKKTKKIIYISLGTVFNNKSESFEIMINACKKYDMDIIVSAGKSYKVLKDKYKENNIRIFERVSQIDVLQKADLFLTHGGKNSINESLKYGVPMILFPVGGEQEYNAKLIEYLKCGKTVEDINEDAIVKTINEVISNNFYLKNTKNLSYKMENVDGAEQSAKIIQELMKENQNN